MRTVIWDSYSEGVGVTNQVITPSSDKIRSSGWVRLKGMVRAVIFRYFWAKKSIGARRCDPLNLKSSKFPMISHCKSLLIYNGKSWEICSILTLTKPISKMKSSIHFGPKICSRWRSQLVNLQFLASGDAYSSLGARRQVLYPPPQALLTVTPFI